MSGYSREEKYPLFLWVIEIIIYPHEISFPYIQYTCPLFTTYFERSLFFQKFYVDDSKEFVESYIKVFVVTSKHFTLIKSFVFFVCIQAVMFIILI